MLDLTRVIAGPVGTRFLAALGADVLRLDPPHLPELPGQVPDGLIGKRSALLDARTDGARLHALLDQADVLVHGYRPGALDRFGLDFDSLAARYPGLVVVQLSAWGEQIERRGFDSIVQAASGIAVIESRDGRPGALPCQLLDHGTGYLVAAAALDSLRRQRSDGGTHLRTLSLAATAGWLLGLPRPENVDPATDLDVEPWLTTIGRVTAVTPPGTLDGQALSWPRGMPEYGGDAANWRASGRSQGHGGTDRTARPTGHRAAVDPYGHDGPNRQQDQDEQDGRDDLGAAAAVVRSGNHSNASA